VIGALCYCDLCFCSEFISIAHFSLIRSTSFSVNHSPKRRQSRNRALADVVAAREFHKRSAFGPSPAGLVLLRLGQFRFPPHALPALLRPAAALGGAGADKVALHVRQAAQYGTAA
jgi:hypothetical protein